MKFKVKVVRTYKYEVDSTSDDYKDAICWPKDGEDSDMEDALHDFIVDNANEELEPFDEPDSQIVEVTKV